MLTEGGEDEEEQGGGHPATALTPRGVHHLGYLGLHPFATRGGEPISLTPWKGDWGPSVAGSWGGVGSSGPRQELCGDWGMGRMEGARGPRGRKGLAATLGVPVTPLPGQGGKHCRELASPRNSPALGTRHS